MLELSAGRFIARYSESRLFPKCTARFSVLELSAGRFIARIFKGNKDMPTSACGINCDVCKLKLMGICSSCGAGKSPEARKKLEAQNRIFGNTCAILSCACMNNLSYCLRDCLMFPCDNFRAGPYPFSPGFLAMQERRRRQTPPALTHNNTPVAIPPEYWEFLEKRDVHQLCNFTFAEPHPSGGLLFRFLQEDILIDTKERCLRRLKEGIWEKTEDPLLELITLLYFNNVKSLLPVGKDIVGVNDLKEAHFFRGPHTLKLSPLLERYGNDPNGFKDAAEYLGGKAVDMATSGYRLLPFPRVPLYYLLWKGDDEFKPKISVLFERSIEDCFEADAIWGLVTRVSFALLKGPEC